MRWNNQVSSHAILIAVVGGGSVGIFMMDQLSKHLATSGQMGRWLVAGGQIGQWFGELIASRGNSDLLFGLDAGLPLWQVGIATGLVTGVWSYLMLRSSVGLPSLVAVALLVPSVLSNLTDRIVFGHVRDWFCIGPTLWNVADFGIALGLTIGLYVMVTAILSDHIVKGGV